MLHLGTARGAAVPCVDLLQPSCIHCSGLPDFRFLCPRVLATTQNFVPVLSFGTCPCGHYVAPSVDIDVVRQE